MLLIHVSRIKSGLEPRCAVRFDASSQASLPPRSGVSMAPRRPTVAWPHVMGLMALIATCVTAVPAHALKVATWNLLGYDDGSVPSVITPRQPHYRPVMAAMDPDLIIVQELITAGA